MKRAFFIIALAVLSVTPVWADPPCRSTGSRGILMPAPLGTYVSGWNGAMAAAASEDQFVIYTQEWFSDGIHLGPYGSYHLQRIIKSLSSAPFPVVIQPCQQDEVLDRTRQAFIVNQLLAAGIRDAAERVIIAYPRAEGLYGDQATRIFLMYNSGSRTGAGGTAGGGGYGGGGGGSNMGFGGTGISGGGITGGFRGY